MLSIYTLKSSKEASKYYQKDNYYAKESDDGYSFWFGNGATFLGLNGQVDPLQFKEALEGRLPNGIVMSQKQKGGHHRPGYDLTFSAPKSVSILAIVVQDERVLQAHRNAVAKVLLHIEEKYGAVRNKKEGAVKIEKTKNLTFAAFEHTDSRSLDPNLHTHCILMNFTQKSDGNWRTIYSDELYKDKLLNGMEYRAELARELMALGFNLIQTSKNGTFELADFDEKLIKQFSKRRCQIEKKLNEIGQSGGKIAKVANFLTREGKIQINISELQKVWDSELQACGASRAWLQEYSFEAKGRGPIIPNEPQKVAIETVDSAIRHLSETKLHFSTKDVLSSAMVLSLLTCDRRQIMDEIAKRVEIGELLPLQYGNLTTKVVQDLQIKLIKSMLEDKSQVKSMTSKRLAGIWAKITLPELNQRDALKHILTSKDRQIGIDTNVSKDYYKVLKSLNLYCYNNNFYPVGIVPSQEEKAKIKHQTGINHSYTLSGFLKSCEERELQQHSKARQLWIIDPNTKVKLEEADKLQAWARRYGARLLWMGESSKSKHVFSRLLQNGMSTVPLKEKAPLENITSSLSAIEIESFLEPKERLYHAVEKYLSMRKEKTDLFVTTHADRIAVNARVREKLIEKAELGIDAIKSYSLQPIFLTNEQKSHIHLYQLEDVLHLKGEYYYVQGVDIKKGCLALENGAGETLQWKPLKSNVNEMSLYRLASRELRVGDILTWTRTMRHFDDKRFYRINGEKAQITSLEEGIVSIKLANGQITVLNNADLRECHFDYGYSSLISKSAPQSDHQILLMTKNQTELVEPEILNAFIHSSKHFCVVTDDTKALTDNLRNLGAEPDFTAKNETTCHIETGLFFRLQGTLNDIARKSGQEILSSSYEENTSLSLTEKMAIEAVDYVCSRLGERNAIFNLEETKAEVFKLVGLKASKQDIERAFTLAFERSLLVNLGNGKLTTQSMLAMEKACLQFVKETQGQLSPILSEAHPLINNLKENPQLTQGQKDAVALTLTTQDRVIGIQGVAGAGKTTMLKEVNRLCQSALTEVNRVCTDAGFRLLGLANTAGAKNRIIEASNSIEGTGIPAMTTKKFLLEAEKLLARDPELAQSLYGKNQILVLDEASLVSTREMFSLLSVSKQLDARVLLIGDVKQLGAIEAGNPWQLLLGNEMKSVAMSENVRFKDPKTVAIMRDLYATKIDEAIDKLTNKTVEIPDREELFSAIANLFINRSKSEQENTLVISPRNEDRIAINNKIREFLKKDGTLRGKEYDSTVLLAKDISDTEKRNFYSYQEGDVLRFNFNSRRMGIESGDYFEISKAEPSHQYLTLVAKDGRAILWSPKQMPQWSGSVEIFQKQNRSLMAGDKIRWRKNDESRGICNGDTAIVMKIEGSIAQIQMRNGKSSEVNLTQSHNQHWDHAYTSTVFVAQGQDVPFTIGLCLGPKAYAKKTVDLKVDDVVSFPKKLQEKETRALSKIVTIREIKEATLTLETKDKELYNLNMSQIKSETWSYYPPFEDIKKQNLPKSSNLSGFLVQATRGDNFMMFVDNLDYFKQSLAANPGIKETALQHLDPEWASKVNKVKAMTASVTGKAMNLLMDRVIEQIDKKDSMLISNNTLMKEQKKLNEIVR